MGAHLVTQVLAHWTHLSDRAFRVLVRMAVTALDKPQNGKPASVYHGGRDLLAAALRSEKGSSATRYRSVKRAVAELTETGAIEHIATGWAGQNAVYRLTLDRRNSVSEPDRMGGQSGPPEGGSSGPPMGGRNGQEWGASQAPPRNQEEPLGELAEEEVVDLRTTSHPSRATAAPPPEHCPTHHIRLKPRTDGGTACPFCRREQRPPPDPLDRPHCEHGLPVTGPDRCDRHSPPPTDIAPVIDLSTWRTA